MRKKIEVVSALALFVFLFIFTGTGQAVDYEIKIDPRDFKEIKGDIKSVTPNPIRLPVIDPIRWAPRTPITPQPPIPVDREVGQAQAPLHPDPPQLIGPPGRMRVPVRPDPARLVEPASRKTRNANAPDPARLLTPEGSAQAPVGRQPGALLPGDVKHKKQSTIRTQTYPPVLRDRNDLGARGR